jgi:hypothetical protein
MRLFDCSLIALAAMEAEARAQLETSLAGKTTEHLFPVAIWAVAQPIVHCPRIEIALLAMLRRM